MPAAVTSGRALPAVLDLFGKRAATCGGMCGRRKLRHPARQSRPTRFQRDRPPGVGTGLPHPTGHLQESGPALHPRTRHPVGGIQPRSTSLSPRRAGGPRPPRPRPRPRRLSEDGQSQAFRSAGGIASCQGQASRSGQSQRCGRWRSPVEERGPMRAPGAPTGSPPAERALGLPAGAANDRTSHASSGGMRRSFHQGERSLPRPRL